MLRLLTIVAAAVAALAVTAAPASAKMHLEDISLGVHTTAVYDHGITQAQRR